MEKLLKTYFYNGNGDWIKHYVRLLFYNIKDNEELSIVAVQDLCATLDLTMNQVLQDVYQKKEAGEIHFYIEKIELHNFLFLSDVVEQLLKEITQVCAYVIEAKKDLSPSIIEDLVSFIKRNYSSDISLEGLAKHRYYVNASYLSRLFKQEKKQSFSSFLTEIRMKEAMLLIEKQELPMSDIASLVGYGDLSYFIKSFKNFYGETPGHLRNQLEKKGGVANHEGADCR